MSELVRRGISVALALGITSAVASCGGGTSTTAQVTGQEIYSSNCAVCHKPDGSGSIGPKISEGATKVKYPEREDQIRLVTEGRNAMPAFGRQLTPTQIETVVDYVRDDL